MALIIPTPGASIAADTFVTRRLSLSTSAHFLGSAEELIMPGGRLGLRFRLHPRFSLGAGASANTGLKILKDPEPRKRIATGFDIELATSRPLSDGRFNSHAWRFDISEVPGEERSTSFVGDWSHSRPTSNPRLRFSYGVNYGVTVWTCCKEEGLFAMDKGDRHSSSSHVGYSTPPLEGPIPFLGVHLGLQFGTPRVMGKR